MMAPTIGFDNLFLTILQAEDGQAEQTMGESQLAPSSRQALPTRWRKYKRVRQSKDHANYLEQL
jgi:hypothetical protein